MSRRSQYVLHPHIPHYPRKRSIVDDYALQRVDGGLQAWGEEHHNHI